LKHEKSPKNEPALSDMLLKLRFAEKKHYFGLFSERSADFGPAAAGSGGWAFLHGGFSRRKSTRTSKSDSLLAEGD
jgi:hypothetical protein